MDILTELYAVSPQGQRTAALLLSLVAGVGGIIYGAMARHFSQGGKYTDREAEIYQPTWRDRTFVILVSGIAVLTSLRFLLKGD